MAEITIPGGREQGTPVSKASESTLKYWAEKAREPAVREACAAELAKRPPAPKRQPPPSVTGGVANAPAAAAQPTTALAARPTQAVAGSYFEVTRADGALREAAAQFHLVSPVTSCGSLPEGCEVAISLVYLDPDPKIGDVAPVGGGKFSLSGNVLKKISAAAGVDWDEERSKRLDDASHPHYCHFRAVGFVRNFDGSRRRVTGEVEIDMRDGSPQVAAMWDRAKEDSNFESQLRDTRLFLLRHAETKAKLRAIADMGVKRSYTKEELSKPFAVARLMFTGRTNDPEARRLFQNKIADSFLSSRNDLYGDTPSTGYVPAALAASAAPAQLPQGHRPPPAGSVPADDSAVPAHGEAVKTPLPVAPPAHKAAPAEPPPDAGDAYEGPVDDGEEYERYRDRAGY